MRLEHLVHARLPSRPGAAEVFDRILCVVLHCVVNGEVNRIGGLRGALSQRGDDLAAISPGLAACVFDFAVNSGPGRAVKLLQEAIGATPDGAIGPLTLRAVAAMPAAEVINKFQDNRLVYLQSLPTWPTFGRGWARRVEEGRTAALQMCQSA